MVLRRTFLTFSFFITIISLTLLFFVGVANAHGDEEHNELPSKVNVCHSLSEAERGNCYIALCEESGFVVSVCVEDILTASVSGSGSQFASAVLTDLLSVSYFNLSDGYEFARKIGIFTAAQHIDIGSGDIIVTAAQYASSGDVFMRCISDFYYGCYYGFFEEVLRASGFTPLEVANTICGSLFGSEQEMCFHKMGHMFMKHNERVLTPALDACDSLPGYQEHCWDGVFMENVNEALRDSALPVNFNVTVAFSPCDEVGDQYRESCYKNHGRYLLAFFEDSSEALAACDTVGSYTKVCRHSVTDALSGAEDHHTHGDVEMMDDVVAEQVSVVTERRSWLQRIFDFIRSLLGINDSQQGNGDDMYNDSEGLLADDFLMIESEEIPLVAPDDVSIEREGAIAVIVYRDGGYVPDRVEVSVGDTVTWVNESSVFWPASSLHPTHKEYPGSNTTKCGTAERVNLFDACEAMGPGAEYSFTFNEVGEWGFHDHINPRAQGVAIVSK